MKQKADEALQDEVRRLKERNAALSTQLTQALLSQQASYDELMSVKRCLLQMMHTRDELAVAAGKFIDIVQHSYGQDLHGPYKALDGPSVAKAK